MCVSLLHILYLLLFLCHPTRKAAWTKGKTGYGTVSSRAPPTEQTHNYTVVAAKPIQVLVAADLHVNCRPRQPSSNLYPTSATVSESKAGRFFLLWSRMGLFRNDCSLEGLVKHVKSSLSLTKYHAMTTYWGWRYSSTHS
jgi:hypothetical protein